MAGLLAEEIEEIILALSQLECEEDKPKLPDEALKTPRGGGGGEATTARAAKKLRERNTHLIREAVSILFVGRVYERRR